MKIKWDEVGKRLYETGVDHGVLFLICLLYTSPSPRD